MNRLTICENALDPATWETYETEDIRAFLKNHFGTWPKNARIYIDHVSQASDVTPFDDATVERLGKLKGHFFVLVMPEGIETIFIIISIVVAAVAVGLAFLLRPHASPNLKNQQQSSPNNELSARSNRERPNERIPDIYGRLWATPDLLAVPYKTFSAGVELEVAFMCIGKGAYTIEQLRDDLTPIDQIQGLQVEVYGPFQSPNMVSPVVQFRQGALIGGPIRAAKPVNSVNGQTLIAPNLPGGGNWVGPFLVGDATTIEILCNFVCQGGAYQIASATGVQSALTVNIEVEATPVDAAGNATGAPVSYLGTITGSAAVKDMVGLTVDVFPLTGMYSIRARRTNNTVISPNFSVSDEAQWREAFSIAVPNVANFGNVTTIYTVSRPTPSALALKQRKLQALVTRNIPVGVLAAGAVTFPTTGPTVNAADIATALSIDPRIGNRTLAEIDLPGLYQAIADVQTYFGTDLCTRFCFTFDDAKVSFEESIADVATAVFCNAFRRGNILSFFFEKLTNSSHVLFNHRNKIPKSETRTVTFGTPNDLDGVEFTYTEPNDLNTPNQDVQKTIYFPSNQSAVNPQRITAVGIRNNIQAFTIAARLYNKIFHQNTVTQFDATEEAALCVKDERILVADNTRPDTQDGDVLDQNALLLTLSQPIKFVGGRTYTIFLQHYDATVESIGITAGPAPNQVILAGAPTLPCVIDPRKYARTTYMIVDNTPQRASAFLLNEKSAQTGKTYQLKASNYDDHFYDNDQDFALAHITFNGEEGEGSAAIAAGATYRPKLYNDLGNFITAGITASAGDVAGHHAAPDDGHVIWKGFAPVKITSIRTLTITYSSIVGSGTKKVTVVLNGTVVYSAAGNHAGGTFTVAIPANTYLSRSTVEVYTSGGAGSDAIVMHVTDITIT